MNLLSISVDTDESCRCEPCGVDLSESNWVTAVEDPFFAGKRCKWHRVINGKRGAISPDSDGRIFVQINRIAREVFDSIPGAIGHVGVSWVSNVQFTVPLGELDRWAKLIGGKRK